MATMNISLPEQMKEWVEAQTTTGKYSNTSDYVRDLIRREQIKKEKIANLQRLFDEGIASGPSVKTLDDIWEEVLQEAGAGAESL